ncbi:terminase small subunit [Mesorhizobium ciceri]|uniref:terminase small subunit n=1 Tax=Mesorhizobium TaxID=68287 RepID=UPI00067F609F|nr:terminase small subunit [Mesorhizobium ciceri]
MPVLDNQRHEAFAQALASGKSADEAYSEAGYKADRGNASRLTANDNIAARVAELQGMAAERVVISREWVIAKLTENVERAMQAQAVMSGGKKTGEYKYDGSVANKALELLGKEIGMFVDRSENVNHNYEISDEPLTPEEWSDEYASTH